MDRPESAPGPARRDADCVAQEAPTDINKHAAVRRPPCAVMDKVGYVIGALFTTNTKALARFSMPLLTRDWSARVQHGTPHLNRGDPERRVAWFVA